MSDVKTAANREFCVVMDTTIGQPWGAVERLVWRHVDADEVDDLLRELTNEAEQNEERIWLDVIEEGSMDEMDMPVPLEDVEVADA